MDFFETNQASMVMQKLRSSGSQEINVFISRLLKAPYQKLLATY